MSLFGGNQRLFELNLRNIVMSYDIIEKSTEFSRDFEVDPKLAEGVQGVVLLNKTIDFLN